MSRHETSQPSTGAGSRPIASAVVQPEVPTHTQTVGDTDTECQGNTYPDAPWHRGMHTPAEHTVSLALSLLGMALGLVAVVLSVLALVGCVADPGGRSDRRPGAVEIFGPHPPPNPPPPH